MVEPVDNVVIVIGVIIVDDEVDTGDVDTLEVEVVLVWEIGVSFFAVLVVMGVGGVIEAVEVVLLFVVGVCNFEVVVVIG